MAVTTDILRTWRSPRAVMRGLLAMGQREDRAVGFLMVACLLIFVAQWPRLTRISSGFDLPPETETPGFDRLIAYEAMAWLIMWPLLFYAIAAVSHLIARLIGGRGSFYTARLALFWSLLASTPLLLLYGLMAGLLGPVAGTSLVGAVWVVAFGVIWVISLHEAERS